MTCRLRHSLVIVALVLAGLVRGAAADDVPFLTGRVVDDAHILSDGARERLTAALKAHEDATSNQVVVLTVPTIGSDAIENYANTVFHTWKLGQKGKDNGVLVVVVPNDHKLRIEVGYGLEGTLPDGEAGGIIRTWMTPAFKAGNYDKGIEDGVAAIVARLDGHEPAGLTPVAPPSRRTTSFSAPDMPWPMRIIFGLFIFGALGLFTVVGILTPGVGWFLYLFLIPFWAIFPIPIIGLGATLAFLATYLIGYPVAKLNIRKREWYVNAARQLKTSGSTSIGGFVLSTAGSGSSVGGSDSSSSSFSSGSDFSGGGGDSGGGGASGSW
jgi:uncharacterized protein